MEDLMNKSVLKVGEITFKETNLLFNHYLLDSIDRKSDVQIVKEFLLHLILL